MTNEIVKADQSSTDQMIQLAIESNADLDKVEKLLELKARHEAHEAKKVFASDFAAVQFDIEAVVKNKNNPQTNSKYAGLDDVIGMSKPVYTKQGFSIIYYEGKADSAENIRVCADVLHKDGHKETYHYDVPLGGVGIKGNKNMTAIHAKATSVTYGRRYLLCMIWNIPTADDDGNVEEKQPFEIPDPDENETAAIDAICNLVKPPDGQVVDVVKATKLMFALLNKYPDGSVAPQKGADWLIGLDRPIFKKDTRSNFEKDNDLPGDEDSTPDEPKECRFLCNACSNEFDKLKNNNCPQCLSNDIVDRVIAKKKAKK